MVHTSAPTAGGGFPAELRAPLDAVARVLIPGDGRYPAGDQAGAGRFIAARAGSGQISLLRRLLAGLPATAPDRLISALTELATDDPASFAQLRDLVYHAYYSSPAVLAALTDRGYDYHGAPQPLGYPLDHTPLTPAHTRGSYLATPEVRRAGV